MIIHSIDTHPHQHTYHMRCAQPKHNLAMVPQKRKKKNHTDCECHFVISLHTTGQLREKDSERHDT